MISIVIVNVSSSSDDFCQTLSNELGDYPYEIVLVTDWAHDDGAGNPNIVRRTGNGIFADMNAGAVTAIGSVLLFLDDTTVEASRDSLIEMIGLALQPETGAVGAKLLYPDTTIKFAGFLIGYRGGIGRIHHNVSASRFGNSYRLAVIQNVSAVSADCMAIRKSVFESVGGFATDSLPNNYGDIDLSFRLLNIGYRNIWTPWAEIIQTGKPAPESIEELEELKLRCQATFKNDPYYNPNLSLETEDLALARPPRLDKY
jgi:GT2 family glycosyltransferase